MNKTYVMKNSKASAAAGRRRITKRSMRPLASTTTLKKCSSSSSIDQRRSSDAEKLEALKKLISPAAGKDEEMAADQLFQETACYILRLKTQVVLLQRLLHLYDSSSSSSSSSSNQATADVDTAVL